MKRRIKTGCEQDSKPSSMVFPVNAVTTRIYSLTSKEFTLDPIFFSELTNDS